MTSSARQIRLRPTLFAVAIAIASASAHAQSTKPSIAPAPGGSSTTGPKPVATSTAATTPPSVGLGGFRLPLLREGTVLARVVGDLALDPDERVWLFRPLKSDPSGLRREFVLLPCGTLEDMLRAARGAKAGLEFEVSGRVFNYRGRNFLLPELAPAIVRVEGLRIEGLRIEGLRIEDAAPADIPKPAAKPTVATTEPVRTDDGAVDQDDAAVADIERRLEQRIGTVPRTVGEQPAAVAGAAREFAAPPVAAGTRLILRRGRLSRDPQAGSWRFVPEQTTGSGDASLELLPCTLLERLENDARQSDAPPIVLLSGTVVAFEGRSYLLPTTVRRAREGRGLTP